jgi:hypothetical protein
MYSPSMYNKTIIPTEYKPYRTLFCCTKYKDRSDFQNILQHLDLPDVQKQIIQVRYINILENFKRRSRNYSYIFFSGHFIITVGSLFVPALLSIQNSDKSYLFSGELFSVHVYWATFVISLLVTIFNGILTLFKVDKKYYFLNTTLERLRSEGWQYFSLTGRYNGRLLHNESPNHHNQFIHFTHYVEKIKMKQVEEEYYKADEKIGNTPNIGGENKPAVTINQELYPPSIDQPLSQLAKNIPEDIRDAVSSIIKSRSTLQQNKNQYQREENVVVIPDTDSISSSSIIIVDKDAENITEV